MGKSELPGPRDTTLAGPHLPPPLSVRLGVQSTWKFQDSYSHPEWLKQKENNDLNKHNIWEAYTQQLDKCIYKYFMHYFIVDKYL